MKSIAIIGGTGNEGRGLALRWARAGNAVTIGSRDAERAKNVAEGLNNALSTGTTIQWGTNQEAVSRSDIAVLTVPFSAQRSTLEQLAPYLRGKVLIDVTVPLQPPKVMQVSIPPEGSAALAAKALLGAQVKVASAFQNVSFEALLGEGPVDCDVLVCGEDRETRMVTMELVRSAGLQPWDAGPLQNSIVAEGLTSVLIRLNKQFGIHHAGIRITGIPRDED